MRLQENVWELILIEKQGTFSSNVAFSIPSPTYHHSFATCRSKIGTAVPEIFSIDFFLRKLIKNVFFTHYFLERKTQIVKQKKSESNYLGEGTPMPKQSTFDPAGLKWNR